MPFCPWSVKARENCKRLYRSRSWLRKPPRCGPRSTNPPLDSSTNRIWGGLSYPKFYQELERCQAPEIPAANTAGFEFIAVRSGPMCFQTDVTFIAIVNQSLDLFLPPNTPRTQRSPNGRVTFHVAVFGVYVRDPILRESRVTAGIWLFVTDESIRRIPDNHQVRVWNEIKDARGFGRRTDVARVLVLQTNDEILLLGQLRQLAQGFYNLLVAQFRGFRTPVGEHAHDAGAEKFRHTESVLGQPRLVFKGVF